MDSWFSSVNSEGLRNSIFVFLGTNTQIFSIILNNCLKCFMPIIFEHSSTFIFANSKKSPEPQTKH